MSHEYNMQDNGQPGSQPTVHVHLVDHVDELLLRGVLSQGAHHGAQLLGGDSPVTVLVEHVERRPVLCVQQHRHA